MHNLSQKHGEYAVILQPFFLSKVSLRCGRVLKSSSLALVCKFHTSKTFKFGIEPIFRRLEKLKIECETSSLVKVWGKFWMMKSTDSSETFVCINASSVNALHLVTSVFNWSFTNVGCPEISNFSIPIVSLAQKKVKLKIVPFWILSPQVNPKSSKIVPS